MKNEEMCTDGGMMIEKRDMPTRKPNRLNGYDYSQNGAYYVTICAKDRTPIFGKIVTPFENHGRDENHGRLTTAPTNDESTVGAVVNRPPNINNNNPVGAVVNRPSNINNDKPLGAVVNRPSNINNDKPVGAVVNRPSNINNDKPVGAVVNRPSYNRQTNNHPYTELSNIGKLIEAEIIEMQKIRKDVMVYRYVIMPDHIHMIIIIMNENNGQNNGQNHGQNNGRLTTAPTTAAVSDIIRLWKRAVSKQIGFSPWQKSFHDHIIRNEDELNRVAKYIENNPIRWGNPKNGRLTTAATNNGSSVGAIVNRPPNENHGRLTTAPTGE